MGCGWLGLPLARVLNERGYEVKGSTRHVEKLSVLKENGVIPFLIDLTPTATNIDSFLASNILLINLPPRNQNNDPDFYRKSLEFVKESAISNGVQKVVFISSTGVYLDQNKKVTEADASYQGLSRAGISLLRMEEIFTQGPFQTTVIRFGGLYGPDRHPGNFLRGKENLAGGSNPINMIQLDDCIGIIQFIVDDEIWGMTFNACSPNHLNRAEFYQKAAQELDVSPPTFSREEKPFKKVSSDLIRSKGYEFIH